MTTLLAAENLYLHYLDDNGHIVQAVDGVTFDLASPGQALGLVGESGSGKSSLALAIMRMLPGNVARYEGQVHLNGRQLLELSDEAFRREIRWRQIALVPQGAMNAFNPVLRVGDQIIEPLVLDGQLSPRQARTSAKALLQRVGLPAEIYQRYPHELSGGMKQRAMIAAAMIMEPSLLLMDEPTSALDVSVQAQITNLLKSLKREQQTAIIFITHDIAVASDVCDLLAVVYGGQIVERGPVGDVLGSPAHPYTQLLLESVPRLHTDQHPAFIPGEPPDLRQPPPGCRFHPRCPYAMPRCRVEPPPAFLPAPDHLAHCWLLD